MNDDKTGSTHAPPPPPHRDDGPRVSRDEVRDLGRLRRTRHDKYVAGVAGGLARHLDIDPVILRVAFVVLTFFGGAGVLGYAVCWLFVPEEETEKAVVDLDVRSRTVVLFVVAILAALFAVGDAFGNGPGGWVAWPLVVVGVITWLVLANRDRRNAEHGAGSAADKSGDTDKAASGFWGGGCGHGGADASTDDLGHRPAADRPRDPRKRGPVLFWFVLPLIALALGTLGIAEAAGAPVHDSAYPALALAIVAAGLLVGAFFGRAGGLILVGFIAAFGLVAGTASDRWEGTTVRETPTTATAVDADYDMVAGEIVLDLTDVRDLDELDGRTIHLDGGAGRIKVRVPSEELDVTLDAEINAGGEIRAFGHTRRGWNTSLTREHDGGDDVPTLRLEAELLFGEIEVVAR